MDDGTTEQWLPVVGYEENYWVSNRGEVWSRPRPRTRGGLLKHVVDKNGYHWIGLTRDGKQRPTPVHRIVMLAFVGPLPEGREIRHLDDDPSNNCWPENLVYGSHWENMQDMVRNGCRRQTHCAKGHEFTPENTLIRKKDRICRTCSREYHREYQRQLRAARRRARDEAA